MQTSIVEAILSGDMISASSLIRDIEDQRPGVERVLDMLFPATGRARIIGITGPPGAGKSSLIAALTDGLVQHGRSVGILCIDPSSPYTGGAFLGDRIRMKRHFLAPEVFIRSIASRTTRGLLCPGIIDIVRVVDALGKDIIIIETIGSGQRDIEIGNICDEVLLVLAPGAGDEIQTMKAGILEIPGSCIVNKMDIGGARQLADDIHRYTGREVILTQALDGKGIGALIPRLLEIEPASRSLDRISFEVYMKIERVFEQVVGKGLARRISKLQNQGLSPYRMFDILVSELGIEWDYTVTKEPKGEGRD